MLLVSGEGLLHACIPSNLICPEDIAEGFNEYFSNIGPDLSSKIDPSNYNFGTISKMLNQNLLRSNILLSTKSHLLHALSAIKATGIDNISCKIIKFTATVISGSLTLIPTQASTISSFPHE